MTARWTREREFEWQATVERFRPTPVAVRPELTDDDVAWLNEQMARVGNPPVRYAREIPLPPVAVQRESLMKTLHHLGIEATK